MTHFDSIDITDDWLLPASFPKETRNLLFELRRREAEGYLQRKQFKRFLNVFCVDHQWEVLIQLKQLLPLEDFLALVGEYWNSPSVPLITCDVLWMCIQGFDRNATRHMMTDEEIREFDELPEELVLYRAYSSDRFACNLLNLSWSLSEDWARQLMPILRSDQLARMNFQKSKALAFFSRRGFREFIVGFDDIVGAELA